MIKNVLIFFWGVGYLLTEKDPNLRESLNLFKSIFMDSPIGIELYDSKGKLLNANKACLDIV